MYTRYIPHVALTRRFHLFASARSADPLPQARRKIESLPPARRPPVEPESVSDLQPAEPEDSTGTRNPAGYPNPSRRDPPQPSPQPRPARPAPPAIDCAKEVADWAALALARLDGAAETGDLSNKNETFVHEFNARYNNWLASLYTTAAARSGAEVRTAPDQLKKKTGELVRALEREWADAGTAWAPPEAGGAAKGSGASLAEAGGAAGGGSDRPAHPASPSGGGASGSAMVVDGAEPQGEGEEGEEGEDDGEEGGEGDGEEGESDFEEMEVDADELAAEEAAADAAVEGEEAANAHPEDQEEEASDDSDDASDANENGDLDGFVEPQEDPDEDSDGDSDEVSDASEEGQDDDSEDDVGELQAEAAAMGPGRRVRTRLQ